MLRNWFKLLMIFPTAENVQSGVCLLEQLKSTSIFPYVFQIRFPLFVCVVASLPDKFTLWHGIVLWYVPASSTCIMQISIKRRLNLIMGIKRHVYAEWRLMIYRYKLRPKNIAWIVIHSRYTHVWMCTVKVKEKSGGLQFILSNSGTVICMIFASFFDSHAGS